MRALRGGLALVIVGAIWLALSATLVLWPAATLGLFFVAMSLRRGSIATPGAVHHNLITDANRHTVVPAENMAEACLRLVHGDASTLSGRITYAADIVEEFKLEPAELIA